MDLFAACCIFFVRVRFDFHHDGHRYYFKAWCEHCRAQPPVAERSPEQQQSTRSVPMQSYARLRVTVTWQQ